MDHSLLWHEFNTCFCPVNEVNTQNSLHQGNIALMKVKWRFHITQEKNEKESQMLDLHLLLSHFFTNQVKIHKDLKRSYNDCSPTSLSASLMWNQCMTALASLPRGHSQRAT